MTNPAHQWARDYLTHNVLPRHLAETAEALMRLAAVTDEQATRPTQRVVGTATTTEIRDFVVKLLGGELFLEEVAR